MNIVKKRGKNQPERDNRIIPTSIFRSQMTERLKQVKNNKKPLILTSHGYGEVAVIPLAMLEDMEAMIGIEEGERDIIEGHYKNLDDLMSEMKRKYGLGCL